jgi:hypothetical protein
VTLLLDSDFLVYRSCYQKGKDYIQILDGLDWCISDIVRKTESDSYRLFLTGQENFRYQLDENYKATRPKEKPKYYYEVRQWLVDTWGAEVSSNCEADDLCAIHQTENTVVGGEDKDLLTIPGWHYRIAKKWNDNRLIYVSEDEASFNFWKQVLTGDGADNVPGLTNPEKLHHKKPPKFSDDTATTVLENKSPEQMKEIVQQLYKQIFGDDWYERYDKNCRLLFLQRKDQKEYFELY